VCVCVVEESWARDLVTSLAGVRGVLCACVESILVAMCGCCRCHHQSIQAIRGTTTRRVHGQSPHSAAAPHALIGPRFDRSLAALAHASRACGYDTHCTACFFLLPPPSTFALRNRDPQITSNARARRPRSRQATPAVSAVLCTPISHFRPHCGGC